MKGLVSRDGLLTETIGVHLESRASKIYDVTNKGTVCKMACTGIRSFAKLLGQKPRIATTGIAPCQAALKGTADCQVPRSGCQEYMRSGQACGNLLSNSYFCLWQSARRLFYLWQSAVLTPLISTNCGAHLSAERGIRLKSSPRHFTSRIPLFEVSYIFAARLLEYKIPTWRIV
jgi:hypothetical protein